jgi:hypothetical protein
MAAAPPTETQSATAPLLCIGHSHVACVARAAAAEGVPLRAFNFWELPGAIRQDGARPVFAAAILDALASHEGPVFSLIGGAAHVVMGMLVHPRRFDFVLPAEPDLPLDPAAEILPAQAVRQTIEALADEYLALMEELGRCCRGPMHHVEPPPPYADSARMHQDVPWGMFPDRCREVSPPALRYKLWRVHSQVLRGWCLRTGAHWVPAPAASMDDAGFMLAPFYGDGAHADIAYGALVLQQMRERA